MLRHAWWWFSIDTASVYIARTARCGNYFCFSSNTRLDCSPGMNRRWEYLSVRSRDPLPIEAFLVGDDRDLALTSGRLNYHARNHFSWCAARVVHVPRHVPGTVSAHAALSSKAKGRRRIAGHQQKSAAGPALPRLRATARRNIINSHSANRSFNGRSHYSSRECHTLASAWGWDIDPPICPRNLPTSTRATRTMMPVEQWSNRWNQTGGWFCCRNSLPILRDTLSNVVLVIRYAGRKRSFVEAHWEADRAAC